MKWRKKCPGCEPGHVGYKGTNQESATQEISSILFY